MCREKERKEGEGKRRGGEEVGNGKKTKKERVGLCGYSWRGNGNAGRE